MKNIPESIRIYQILMEPDTTGKIIDEKRSGLRRRYWVVAALAVLVIVIAAAAFWIYTRSTFLYEKKVSKEKTTISLPEKPSIAVLPFKNLSDNPEQEFFCDGITNDIITDLSKFRHLFVIASNTVFTYKGKSVKITEVGKELSVKYVLEGSVHGACGPRT